MPPIRSGRVIARLAPIAPRRPARRGLLRRRGGGIKISDAWARTSPMVAGAGRRLHGHREHRVRGRLLVGATSDVAKAVEVHETRASSRVAPMESTGMGGRSRRWHRGGMGTGGSDDGHAARWTA